MTTKRISSRTQKFLKLRRQAQQARIKTARTAYERAQKDILLLQKLSQEKNLAAEAFFARVPTRLVNVAAKVFDQIEATEHKAKLKLPEGITLVSTPRQRFGMLHQETKTIPEYVPIQIGGHTVLTSLPQERLKYFMLNTFLKRLKLNNSLFERRLLNRALKNKPTAWPKEFLNREKFTVEAMTNFPIRFAYWHPNYKTRFNKRFAQYMVTIELLEQKYPKLMKRVNKTTKEEKWPEFTKEQMDDYYKIYAILRGQYRVPNRILFA